MEFSQDNCQVSHGILYDCCGKERICVFCYDRQLFWLPLCQSRYRWANVGEPVRDQHSGWSQKKMLQIYEYLIKRFILVQGQKVKLVNKADWHHWLWGKKKEKSYIISTPFKSHMEQRILKRNLCLIIPWKRNSTVIYLWLLPRPSISSANEFTLLYTVRLVQMLSWSEKQYAMLGQEN